MISVKWVETLPSTEIAIKTIQHTTKILLWEIVWHEKNRDDTVEIYGEMEIDMCKTILAKYKKAIHQQLTKISTIGLQI